MSETHDLIASHPAALSAAASLVLTHAADPRDKPLLDNAWAVLVAAVGASAARTAVTDRAERNHPGHGAEHAAAAFTALGIAAPPPAPAATNGPAPEYVIRKTQWGLSLYIGGALYGSAGTAQAGELIAAMPPGTRALIDLTEGGWDDGGTYRTGGAWDRYGVTSGGDVLGDYQDGESLTRRWTEPTGDGTWTVIDFYAANVTEGGRNGISVMVTYTVCTDPESPGDTEIWADMRYWDGIAEEGDTPRAIIERLNAEDISEAHTQMAR